MTSRYKPYSRLGGKYTVVTKYGGERQSPEYKLWKMAVMKRDEFKCLKCKQKLRRGKWPNLQVHHIRKYSDFPELRFDVNNGITLCWNCHKLMKDVEYAYIPMCMALLSNKNTYIEVQRMLREEERREQNGGEEISEVSGDQGSE